MYEFEIGDVVRLKSGGPAATLVGFDAVSKDKVWIAWFDDNDHYHEKLIFPACLISTEP